MVCSAFGLFGGDFAILNEPFEDDTDGVVCSLVRLRILILKYFERNIDFTFR